MEGRGPLVRDLTRRLRGADFRQALKAVAELRHLDRAVGAHVISSLTPADEQRAFQLLIARLVAEGGVHGLAARWSDLPSPQWRERLVSEIGQAVHLWVDRHDRAAARRPSRHRGAGGGYRAHSAPRGLMDAAHVCPTIH